MGLMIADLYDALRNPPDEERARKAAEAVAKYEDRANELERKVDRLDAKLDRVIWMIGVVASFQAATIAMLFWLARS